MATKLGLTTISGLFAKAYRKAEEHVDPDLAYANEIIKEARDG